MEINEASIESICCEVITIFISRSYFSYLAEWDTNFLNHMQIWVQKDLTVSGQSQMFMRVIGRYKLSSNMMNTRYQGTACLMLMRQFTHRTHIIISA